MSDERFSPDLLPELGFLVHADLLAQEGDGYPTYFAASWPAGEALARFVLDAPEHVRGLGVLDFGTGSGVVAMAAAVAGARRVLGVDRDPRAVEALRRNAEAAGLPLDACVGDPLEAPLSLHGIDVILAADVFYDDAGPTEVGRWLRGEAAGRRVIASDPGRLREPLPGMRAITAVRHPRGTTCTLYEIEPPRRRVFRR